LKTTRQTDPEGFYESSNEEQIKSMPALSTEATQRPTEIAVNCKAK